MLKLRKGDGPKAAVLCVLILATGWFIYHELAQASSGRIAPRATAPGKLPAAQTMAPLSAGKPLFAPRPEVGASLARLASVPDPFQPAVADQSPTAAAAHTEPTVLKPRPGPPLPGPAQTDLPNLRLVGIMTNPSLAVLQEGDDRRLVRAGESLADDWRVASITAREVTLAKGAKRVTLRLGADQKRPPGRLSPLRP